MDAGWPVVSLENNGIFLLREASRVGWRLGAPVAFLDEDQGVPERVEDSCDVEPTVLEIVRLV
jgi:hypothetical protein